MSPNPTQTQPNLGGDTQLEPNPAPAHTPATSSEPQFQNPNINPGRAQSGPNPGPNPGPTVAQPGPNRGPTWAQPEPNRGPTGAQPGPNRGPTWAQPGPNLGPTGAQPRLNPGPNGGRQVSRSPGRQVVSLFFSVFFPRFPNLPPLRFLAHTHISQNC